MCDAHFLYYKHRASDALILASFDSRFLLHASSTVVLHSRRLHVDCTARRLSPRVLLMTWGNASVVSSIFSSTHGRSRASRYFRHRRIIIIAASARCTSTQTRRRGEGCTKVASTARVLPRTLRQCLRVRHRRRQRRTRQPPHTQSQPAHRALASVAPIAQRLCPSSAPRTPSCLY
jgi:hypothetical protein